MKDSTRNILLAAVAVIIVGSIYSLESSKTEAPKLNVDAEIATEANTMDITEKAAKYERAKELVAPSGFINTNPLTIEKYIGKKVILVDFWTYSCINCQRTLPYLTAWNDKYADDGLLILGVHTPEFDFEKKRENVIQAAKKFGVEYPIIQDNDYGTWRAYKNRYWPRKYLIDIDGFIVYDHIGEGAYEETERKIQELLQERMVKLGMEGEIDQSIAEVKPMLKGSGGKISPETYFGSLRNRNFGNGISGQKGIQNLAAPAKTTADTFYLEGEWDIQPEYALNTSGNAKIIFPYTAKDVFMVLSAEDWVQAQILIDGEPIESDIAGEDVDPDGKIHVHPDQLYHLVSDPDGASSHTLEIQVEDPGLKAFTFTFG